MIALTRPQAPWGRMREPAALRRALIAGTAWGVSLAAGLTTLSAWQCGGICIDEAIWLSATSIATGIVTIGPIAAFGRRAAQRST